ncbi:hypothetical protein WCE41_00630 [Luteimonas sp. MJ246]|uniref:hypothetical protein n=1 Tax=Luteimonas sp. MJ174 TaxID=3129237 RepID=UPI0031BA471C
MRQRNMDIDARAAQGLHAGVLLLVLAAAYIVFAFGLTANSPFPFYPDDFSFLAGSLADMGWNWKRPVSTNIIFLVAACGQVASYAILAASTVLVAWLVLLLLRDVFGVGIGALPAAACGVVLFSHAGAFEHGKYLGLMTNLVSHGFGLASLLLLWRGWRGGRAWPCLVAALAYLASAFAKEDFLLPPLLLLALLWMLDRDAGNAQPRRLGVRARMVLSLLFVTITCGSMAWSAYDRNPFVAGLFSPDTSSASYAVELAPTALVGALRTLFIGYTGVATLLSAAACVALCMVPALRLRVLWFAATLLALALPYAVIPNNMPGYRAYAWLPWMAAMLAVALAYWQRSRAGRARGERAVPVVAALLVALLAAWGHHDARLALAQRYAAGESVNRRMLELLESARAELRGAPLVGLQGLDGPSPWCGNGTLFLHRKRGFDQRWLVFAPGPTPCYQNPVAGRLARHDLRLSVASPLQACAMDGLPVLAFEADGSGRLVTAREVCAAARGPGAAR